MLASTLLALPFPAIDPVAFQLGPIAIRWYALAYIAGLMLGWWLARRIVEGPGWSMRSADVDDLLFYMTLGVIFGGRLGYVFFYNAPHYLANPAEILTVWRGGMSFHGGLIGVILAILLFARNRRLNPFEVGDIAATVAPLGLFFGRIANFVNGELYGRVADVPWAMAFPDGGPLPRHPSQLYEAFLEGFVLFLVMMWFVRQRSYVEPHGFLGGIFLIGYAIARMICELFREPDVQLGFLLGGATMGQLLSIPMLAFGVFLVIRSRRRAARLQS